MPNLPIPIIRKIISEIDFSSFLKHINFFSRLMTFKTQQKVEWNYFLDRARKKLIYESNNFHPNSSDTHAFDHLVCVFFQNYRLDDVTVGDLYYYPKAQDMYRRIWYNLDSKNIYSPHVATDDKSHILAFLKYIHVTKEIPDLLKFCRTVKT